MKQDFRSLTARRRLDIAIAGCGPAGLASALFLARAGHRVTLFDQFERPRPLGSGLILQPTGLEVLSEIGLDEPLLGLGQRIDRLFGRVCPSQRIVLDVRYDDYRPGAFGLAVHRGALFFTLHQAVLRAGVPVETGWAVAEITASEGSRSRLIRRDGASAGPFDLVVDALGARSVLQGAFDSGREVPDLAYGALWASLPWPASGFDPHVLEQRYQRASVMVGVLPIGRLPEGESHLGALFWSLKPADYALWRAAGLGAWKDRVVKLWPQTAEILEAIRDPEALTLARYSHRTLRRPCSAAVVAVGDSAHTASPQLGQGANMALLDARALAVALDISADLSAALGLYAAFRRWHVRFYQALCFTFTPLYQSDSRALPLIRDWVMAPLTRVPGLRGMVASVIAGSFLDPRRPLSVAAPARNQGVGEPMDRAKAR